MKTISLNGRPLATRVQSADNLLTRFWGLMGKKELGPLDGLLLTPCKQVHMFFMRFPLDILYLSSEFNVLKIVTLKPGTIGPYLKNAAYVLETTAGNASKWGIRPNDVLRIEDSYGL